MRSKTSQVLIYITQVTQLSHAWNMLAAVMSSHLQTGISSKSCIPAHVASCPGLAQASSLLDQRKGQPASGHDAHGHVSGLLRWLGP